MKNLPSLTDFGNNKDEAEIVFFLEDLVFSSINKDIVAWSGNSQQAQGTS
jgi:hypothetical protein